MKGKRGYSAVDVEKFDAAVLLPQLTIGCIVAIDVAKTRFVAAIATAAGEVVKFDQVRAPAPDGVVLADASGAWRRRTKAERGDGTTGTYGDALRHQCHQQGLSVHMMPPKHTHDFAEVLDGVPSMHDAKAAVVLAKLQAIKPARAWLPESEERRDLRAWVDQRRPISCTLALYHGHLEGMLARHWPEAELHLDVYRQRSWMTLMKAYPGPEAVAADGEAAKALLRKASRGRLAPGCLEALVASAEGTKGVPMTHGEQEKLRAVVEQMEVQSQRLAAVDRKLAELVESDEVLTRMATVVGPACAATIGALVGSPLAFANARAFEKGMGLNLKEKSSGNVKGNSLSPNAAQAPFDISSTWPRCAC